MSLNFRFFALPSFGIKAATAVVSTGAGVGVKIVAGPLGPVADKVVAAGTAALITTVSKRGEDIAADRIGFEDFVPTVPAAEVPPGETASLIPGSQGFVAYSRLALLKDSLQLIATTGASIGIYYGGQLAAEYLKTEHSHWWCLAEAGLSAIVNAGYSAVEQKLEKRAAVELPTPECCERRHFRA